MPLPWGCSWSLAPTDLEEGLGEAAHGQQGGGGWAGHSEGVVGVGLVHRMAAPEEFGHVVGRQPGEGQR